MSASKPLKFIDLFYGIGRFRIAFQNVGAYNAGPLSITCKPGYGFTSEWGCRVQQGN